MKPNVLVISLVSLRADHVSYSGYHRDTTPNIDRLASEGAVFERAYSTSGWTAPAYASVLTGLYPSCHGILGEEGLADSLPTLASLLSEVGYRSVGFVTHPHVGKLKKLDRGFDEFFEVGYQTRNRKTGEPTPILSKIKHRFQRAIRRAGMEPKPDLTRRTTNLAMEWLRTNGKREKPFLMLLHYNEIHYPYQPPFVHRYRYVSRQARRQIDLHKIRWLLASPYYYLNGVAEITQQELEFLKALYDAEIYYTDKWLGRLFTCLREMGILDQTIVVVMSPHGENFGEHGLLEHRQSLYEQLVRIPMVIRYPEVAPAGLRVRSLVQSTDLFPSILEMAGYDQSKVAHQGVSLLPMERDRAYRAYVVGERNGTNVPEKPEKMHKMPKWANVSERQPAFHERFSGLQRMICQGDHKYICSSGGSEELFNLTSDPNEEHNLVAQEPEHVRMMAGQLKHWAASFKERRGVPDPKDVEDSLRESLRATGYRL